MSPTEMAGDDDQTDRKLNAAIIYRDERLGRLVSIKISIRLNPSTVNVVSSHRHSVTFRCSMH